MTTKKSKKFKRNTLNKINRNKSFKQKRTGKIMPKLLFMTEDLTVQLSEALSGIRVRDFETVREYIKARTNIIKSFSFSRKEMFDAIQKLNKTSKMRF